MPDFRIYTILFANTLVCLDQVCTVHSICFYWWASVLYDPLFFFFSISKAWNDNSWCIMFVQFHLPTMHIWQLFVQGSTWSQSPQTVDHWPVEWVQLAEAWAQQVLPLELTVFQQADQCGHFPHWRKMSRRLCSIVEVHLKKMSDHTYPWQVVGGGEIRCQKDVKVGLGYHPIFQFSKLPWNLFCFNFRYWAKFSTWLLEI